MTHMFLLITYISFFSSHLYAGNYEYSGLCKPNAHAGDFEKCLDDELTRYDNELNKLYKSYFNKAPNEKLKKVEVLWIKFKEADCDYMASEVHGGQYYADIYKVCLISKTKVRIAELKRSFLYHGWFKNS